MRQVSEVMKEHPEFCNPETRVPDIKYILKKYNYDEIVIVDFDRHPVGIVNERDVSDEAMKKRIHPFDVNAGELMTSISATVKKNTSLEDCLQLMEEKHVASIPVTDEEGHYLGVVKKEEIINYV